jgi:hypothetical protein
MDDGSIVRINTNTTLQFDLAVNLDSPGALAKATSTNTTLQANRGPFIGGHASGSNDTVQISLVPVRWQSRPVAMPPCRSAAAMAAS